MTAPGSVSTEVRLNTAVTRLWALGALLSSGCGSPNLCPEVPYAPKGEHVASVEECPPFPESCPLTCFDPVTCSGTSEGAFCEDCAELQAYVEDTCTHEVRLEFRTGFALYCGGKP